MKYTYNFPVVKGIQANKDYYIAMVPLKMIPKLFREDEQYVEPEYRAQRKLNITRIPIMTNYVLDNRDSYVFSALAASIDGKFDFLPVKDLNDVGILEIEMDARFLINDGQHRKAAIIEAMQEDPSLGDETIPIVFFKDTGLQRSQQIFTDLNKNAVKTSNSISELYDYRDNLAVVTRSVVRKIDFLNEYTDKETDNLGKYSSKLFTLNTLYKANKRAVGNVIDEKRSEKFLLCYWKSVVDNIIPWQEMINKEISKKELRESYIVTQGVVIQALGYIGAHFFNNTGKEDVNLTGLRTVNWKRSAKEWKLRTIRENGRIITNNNAILLTANVLKKAIGIKLTEDDIVREQKFTDKHIINGD